MTVAIPARHYSNYQESPIKQVIGIIEPIFPDWFLIGGGCLGYVREKELIKHDLDIDIGIYAEERLVEELINQLPVHTKYYYDGQLREITFFLECSVDIFFLFRHN